jgi:hypothetical protein
VRREAWRNELGYSSGRQWQIRMRSDPADEHPSSEAQERGSHSPPSPFATPSGIRTPEPRQSAVKADATMLSPYSQPCARHQASPMHTELMVTFSMAAIHPINRGSCDDIVGVCTRPGRKDDPDHGEVAAALTIAGYHRRDSTVRSWAAGNSSDSQYMQHHMV